VRPLGWLGVVLLVLGAVIASGKVPYRTSSSEMHVGPMSVKSEANEYLPPTVGIVAMVIGAGLVFEGRKRI
jgi:hypothetical protein